MSTTKVIQVSFAGGEISTDMYGRQDDTKYQAGLKKCLNFVALPQGPVRSRPGFALVSEVKNSNYPVRVIPFQFSSNETAVIELGNKYMRVHTDGGTVMTDDGSAPYEVETPWRADDLFDIDFAQSGDIITCCHRSYPPTEIRRYGWTDWRIVQCSFTPKLATPGNVAAIRKTAAAEDSNAEKYTFKYKVSALNSDKSIEGEASAAVSCTANLYATGTTIEISWDAVEGASFYRVYKNVGGIYGYIGDTEETSFIDNNISAKTDVTVRRFDDIFLMEKGIAAVTVTNGGSGYKDGTGIKTIDRGTNGFSPIGYSIKATGISSDNFRAVECIGSPTVSLTTRGNSQSGVAVKANWTVDLSYSYTTDDDGDKTYYVRAVPRVTSFEVTASGSGYTGVDKVTVNWSGVQCKFTYERRYYSHGWKTENTTVTATIERTSSGSGGFFSSRKSSNTLSPSVSVGTNGLKATLGDSTTCYVTDSTGSGALLTPVVTDGKVTSFIIEHGGHDYTSPTIVIQGDGTGAAATATIGDAGDYPGAVSYFEQRKIFAGFAQNPQRIAMTRPGSEDDMTYALPYVDDDRIKFEIASREYDMIQHVVPLSHLLVLTSGNEMRISPLNSDAITPDSVSARPQAYIGASKVMPAYCGNAAVYAANRGGHVYSIAYNYNAGGYVPSDISIRATHFFDFKTVKDMTYSKSPYGIVWCVSSDGKLLGCTYSPEQNLEAWHQHETDGVFESVCSVAEGTEDHLYCVIKRVINDKTYRFIERMESFNFDQLEDAFFVDCGGTYEGAPTTTVSIPWLEGADVAILADGAVLPQQTVKDGKITLDVAASKVTVGLPYVCDVQTLPVTLEQVAAGGNGLRKNIFHALLKVNKTSGLSVGPDFDNLVEYKQRSTESPGYPPELFTGDMELQTKVAWGTTGECCVRQEDPLPAHLLMVVFSLSI